MSFRNYIKTFHGKKIHSEIKKLQRRKVTFEKIICEKTVCTSRKVYGQQHHAKVISHRKSPILLKKAKIK